MKHTGPKMNKTIQLTATLTLVSLIAGPSAFAETRHQTETAAIYIAAHAITVEGRIRNIGRDRNGFVIHLDRGATLFASSQTVVSTPARRVNAGLRHLDRGDVIRATGHVRVGNAIHITSITLLRNDDRDERTLRGIVQSVDARQRLVVIREDRTPNVVAVDLGDAERNDRRWDNERDNRWSDLRNIRPGDRLTASGEWQGDRFEAERFDVGENGRR